MKEEWPRVARQEKPLEQFLSKLEKTYAAGRVIKPESAEALLALALAVSDPATRFKVS